MTDRETIKHLTEALQAIGCLPLEFNGRARAIAQHTVKPPEGGWKDTLSPEQIKKLLLWAPPTEENFYMQSKEHADLENAGTTTTTEEPLFPANPATYEPPEIDMIPVESSNIEGFGHDGDKTLRVWFKNGTKYDYVGIPEEDFFALLNADSAGKAYNALMKEKNIKGIKH